MSSSDPEETSSPPLWAKRLLRRCCSRERLEEIEGDLHELYQSRRRTGDSKRADGWYAREAVALSVRQLLRRSWRAAASPRRLGALEVYPLRAATTTLVLLLAVRAYILPTEHPWAITVKIVLALIVNLGFPWTKGTQDTHSSARRGPSDSG